MILKAEVLEILERNDKYVKVFASYCRGHKILSPRGFEYIFNENYENIQVGSIWDVGFNYNGEISRWPNDNESIIGSIPSDEFFANQTVEIEKLRNEERAEK